MFRHHVHLGLVAGVLALAVPSMLRAQEAPALPWTPDHAYRAPSEPLEDEWDSLSAPSLALVGYYAATAPSPTTMEVDGHLFLDESLETLGSVGARLYFDLHIGPFLSVGAAAGVSSWTTEEEQENDDPRSLLWSASGTVTLWLPVVENLRFYLRAMGGLSFDVPPASWAEEKDFVLVPGWHVGGSVGMYAGNRRVGWVVEFGAVTHHLDNRIQHRGETRGHFRRQLTELPFSSGIQVNL